MQIQEHVQMLASIHAALLQLQEFVRSGMSSTTAHVTFPAIRGVIVVLMQSHFVLSVS